MTPDLPPPEDLISLVPLPCWIRAAVRCGFALAPLLRELGISVASRGTRGIVITQAQSLQLMSACVAQARRGHFPFVLGEHCVLESIPEVQAYMCSSGSLRVAIEAYNWVRELMGNGLSISLVEAGAKTRIRLDVAPGLHQHSAGIHFAETRIASIVQLVTQLLGDPDIDRLTFQHAAPAYAEAYGHFFGRPVRFDQAESAVVLRSDLLDQPLLGAVPELHQQSREAILRRMAELTVHTSMTARLSQLFSEHPHHLTLGIEAAAAQLQVHPRTLQRRLQDENRTFADVQSKAQFQATCALLRDTRCNLDEISEKLGFSDRRAFTRAFKRWTNVSPQRFRSDLGKLPVRI